MFYMFQNILYIYKTTYILRFFHILLSPCPVSYHSSLGFVFICPYVQKATKKGAYEHKLGIELLCDFLSKFRLTFRNQFFLLYIYD